MTAVLEPEILDVEHAADEIAAWAATAPLGDGIYTPFGELDPARLSQDGRVHLAVALERVRSWVDAQQAKIFAYALDHPDPVPAPKKTRIERDWAAQEFARDEFAAALRWSPGTTSTRMHDAHALLQRHPRTFALLETGAVSWLHARALVDATRGLDPALAGRVEDRVLARAARQNPAELRRSLRRAVAAADPRGQAEQHQAAAERRRVAFEPDQHAMGWVHAYLPALDAQIVWQAVQAVADRSTAHPGDGRSADQRRADALVEIGQAVLDGQLIGLTTPPGPTQPTGPAGPSSPTTMSRRRRRRRRGRTTVQVTIALSTLLGLDGQPADLDGYGPIPAEAALHLATDPHTTWRRLITDDHGRLLDYGHTRYRPPQHLIDHITARDRTCRGPGCTRPATRCEYDHIVAWSAGGTTCAQNLHALCPRHHHLKHDAGWHVHRHPDGTTTWTSPTGRTYTKPPDTYPIDHTRAHTQPDTDPPPF